MNTKMKFLTAIFAFALLTVALPAATSAQWRDRNNDDDDNYGNTRNNGNNGNYNRRNVENAVKRIESKADSFRDDVEDAIDDNGNNNNNRGRRNNDAQQLKSELNSFVNAAETLEDRFDGGRNLNRSRSEAQNLIRSAESISRLISRSRLDNRAANQWNQMKNDLRTVANAYNINFNDRNRGGVNLPGRGNGNGTGGWKLPW